MNFIDRQLCGPYKALQQTYRKGLRASIQSSRGLYAKAFVDLSSAQQNDVLRQLENGKAPGAIWKQVSSSEFFGYLVDHTMQGFYGDPRHGGNRDAVSWRMLGVPDSRYAGATGTSPNRGPEKTLSWHANMSTWLWSAKRARGAHCGQGTGRADSASSCWSAANGIRRRRTKDDLRNQRTTAWAMRSGPTTKATRAWSS